MVSVVKSGWPYAAGALQSPPSSGSTLHISSKYTALPSVVRAHIVPQL